MARNLIIAVCGLMVIALTNPTARAQDDFLVELYGRGVHAYFDGQHAEAHKLLTTAIDQGSKDPRVYYFRGMSFVSLGRSDEASADFKAGAELEVKLGNQNREINLSLQRLQGAARIELEQFRTDIRLASRINERTELREKLQGDSTKEATVLRNESEDQMPKVAEVEIPMKNDPVGDNPFGEDNDPNVAPATNVVPTDQGNPFTDDPEPSTPDPFTDDPAPNTPDPFETPGEPDPFDGPGTSGPAAPAGKGPLSAIGRALGGTLFKARSGLGVDSLPIPGVGGGGNEFDPGNDPFGNDGPGEEPGGDPFKDDPFGGDDPAPGNPAPAPAPGVPAPAPGNPAPAPGVPAPAPGDNPFGNDNPFGDDAPAEPAPAEPAPQPKDDPFGDDPFG
jgi:hypothetical protein